jgi:hypothetical protein
MEVKHPTHGRYISLEKFYERVIYYKDKDNDDFLLNEYHMLALDNDMSMSFVSPRGLSLIKKNDKGDKYTEVLEYDEALKILQLYLRKIKINKIMR